jgi:hypothetical protein
MAPSPTPLPSIPGEQHVREAVVGEPGQGQHQAVAEQGCQPALARRHLPHRNRDVGADDQAAGLIGRMQAAADVVEGDAEASERVGLFVDVLEGNVAGANG